MVLETSELVQLKQNIETSVGESTPTEAEHGFPLPLIEVGVLKVDKSPRYLIIDPYPSTFIEEELEQAQLIKSRVESLDPVFFEQLQANDVLFIDSGHSVRIGSDVNFLFLDVLPRLAPGVLVHIHDINLPYEYHKVYATNESFRQFWTEQYLLQAFLSYNDQFEILLGMYYLMKDHLENFRQSFPHYDSNQHLLMGSSFWFRRKPLKA